MWEDYLPFVELSYKNGYEEPLRMNLFEALYGQSCNYPINCSDTMNKVLIRLDMLVEMEQEMKVIKNNLNATHDKQGLGRSEQDV